MLYNANLAYAVTLGGANDGGESSLVVNRVVLFVACAAEQQRRRRTLFVQRSQYAITSQLAVVEGMCVSKAKTVSGGREGKHDARPIRRAVCRGAADPTDSGPVVVPAAKYRRSSRLCTRRVALAE